MKHIQTLNTRDMAKSAQNGGCGECQTSCQSACKRPAVGLQIRLVRIARTSNS